MVTMEKTRLKSKKENKNSILLNFKFEKLDKLHVFLLYFLGEFMPRNKQILAELDTYLGDLDKSFYFESGGYKTHLSIFNKDIHIKVICETETKKNHLKKIIAKYFMEQGEPAELKLKLFERIIKYFKI